MSKSTHLENAVLNWYRGTAFPTAPANVYVSLHTADPTDAGSGAEVSGGAYARVAVSVAAGSWNAPTDSSGSQLIDNVGAVTLGSSPSGGWG